MIRPSTIIKSKPARGEPLALRQLLERRGEKRDAGAVVGKAKELDRRALTDRAERGVVLAERAEYAGGKGRDLARAAIADLERVDLGTTETEL
jgi:hypothetical protein